jgi:hypothetical protein
VTAAEYWATEEIPGIAWNPNAEPPDDDDGEGPGVETVTVTGDLL